MKPTLQQPQKAKLLLDGWDGRSEQDVEIVGETRKLYRIRCIARTRLAGRGRYGEPGQVVTVPKYAIKVTN